MQNGGFLIAKVLVGAFSVKLCEGSLTALLVVEATDLTNTLNES